MQVMYESRVSDLLSAFGTLLGKLVVCLNLALKTEPGAASLPVEMIAQDHSVINQQLGRRLHSSMTAEAGLAFPTL